MGTYNIIILDKDERLDFFLSKQNLKTKYVIDFDSLIDSVDKEEFDVAIINPEINKEDITTIVKRLLKKSIPVLVTLERNSDVEKIIDGLSAGAFDYFQKPVFSMMTEETKNSFLKELLFKINLAAESRFKTQNIDLLKDDFDEISYNFKKASDKIIVIGSSTGGPQSLDQIIPLFPEEIPAPIIIIQHMPEIFTKKFAERLALVSNVKVKEAEEGEEIKNGVCYVAKGDYHLELKKNSDKKVIIHMNKKEKILGVRPSVNVTMESASKIYKKNVIGVILTGMGSDGTIGCKKIKEKGGTVIVESEKTSVIYGMPKSVINSGYYDVIVDLQKITVAVIQMLKV